jgi:hypothetical protein
LGRGFLLKADKMMKTGASHNKVAAVAQDGHKFIVAAVECATKVAPYIHARLLAVESRGDMTEDKAPFVLRAPLVMPSSEEWQAMASQQGAALDNLDKAERKAIQEHLREREATRKPPIVESAPRASGDRLEGMPHPAMPSGSAGSGVPASEPVVLVADQKTSRITAMPVGPVVLKPAGSSEEWLESTRKVGSLKIVSK